MRPGWPGPGHEGFKANGPAMTSFPPRGLYAVTTDADTDPARLVCRASAAIDGGAVVIQYRAKERPYMERRIAAAALLDVCRARGVPLIVNDDPGLAAEIDADGVHIGRDDGGVHAARRVLGDRCIVGASCYDRLDLASAAAGDGATYVAFGSFFASPTKPFAVPAPIELLSNARERLDVSIVAIGGITVGNGARLIAAGADLLAVVSGVFGGGDEEVEHAARGYATLFQ